MGQGLSARRLACATVLAATVAIAASPVSPAIITHIAVIGERHSGTSFMRRLLSSNLNATRVTITSAFCDTKHKYQFPGPNCPPLETSIAVVMLRNPFDWALAMHRNCWCEEDETLSSLPFEAFLQQPWLDNSVKPWTGESRRSTCKNLMHCRKLKTLNFLNMSSWARHVEFVRHEDVITGEQSLAWLMDFVERHRLPLQSPQGRMKAVGGYKGEYTAAFDSSQSMATSVWFNASLVKLDPDLKARVHLISRTMDLAVESMIGYFPI